MKKVSFILAALATIAVAAPTVASAESFGFHVGVGPDHYYRDRDYNRGLALNSTVMIVDGIAAGITTMATG
jgi:hypothetical protein